MSKDVSKEHFKVLNNETRRQIIQHLAREKMATFTQIMNFLELDPLWQCGTIGYHLNLLVTSGIARKHEDGYILTAKGKAVVHMIEKIENVEVDEKLERPEKTEEILKRLNPRSVCWLLAVSERVKPAATILSVDKEDWDGFLRVLDELNLCWSYNGVNGMILSSPENEAEKLFDSLSTKSNEARINFLFDDENWEKLVNEKKPSFEILSSSSAKLTPLDSQGFIPIYEVVTSKNLKELITFARFNQRTGKPACWSDHIAKGKALGYPDCCIEAFEKGGKRRLHPQLVARHNFFKELIDLGLDEEMPVEFWAIAHVPCSAKCEESLKLGRKYLDAVKSYSPSLYNYVQEKLRASYLAYSVGERFLNFKEVPQDQFPSELKKEYDGILNWAKKIVSEDVKLTLGDVQRPLVYADWEDYPARCRLIPKIKGLKWIAYSPGKGMLVRDTKTNEVYLYGILKWLLPNEYEEIMDTVCRVYKCN